jgi:hypothetical protein
MPLCSIMRRKKTWWLQGALVIQKDKNKELSGYQLPFWSRMRKKNIWWPLSAFTLDYEQILQQKVSLYVKWFHWIMSEFISYSEWDLMGK